MVIHLNQNLTLDALAHFPNLELSTKIQHQIGVVAEEWRFYFVSLGQRLDLLLNDE